MMNSLTRLNQLNELEDLQHRLRSLFSRSRFHWPEGQENVAHWIPLVEIREDPKEYLIKAQLPQVTETTPFLRETRLLLLPARGYFAACAGPLLRASCEVHPSARRGRAVWVLKWTLKLPFAFIVGRLRFEAGKMKRNMDLIRLLLMQSEGETSVKDDLEKFSIEEQTYHTQLLLDAGFVEGRVFDEETCVVQRLTWAGHDFLHAMRDDTVWKKAKEHVLKPGASWTFDVLKEWLKAEVKAKRSNSTLTIWPGRIGLLFVVRSP